MKRRKFKLFNKWVLAACVIFISGAAGAACLARFIRSSEYFSVREIIFNETNSRVDPSYLKGHNIFALDLPKEAELIGRHYPTYRKIRLIRIPPNRIFIDFIRRRPLGIVKLSRWLCVDEEGVLFEPPEQAGENGLPYISGLETKIFDPRPGKKYNNKELALALSIIKEAGANKLLKDYNIARIDVASLSSASIFILEPLKQKPGEEQAALLQQAGLEVKLGAEDIRGKINILAGLLGQIKNDSGSIKYIDLRFSEPVVRFNEAPARRTK